MAKAFLVEQRLRAYRADGAPVTEQTGALEALWLRYPAQGSAWGLNGGVDVRLLRLTDPCAGAPVRGRGGLAAGPGDLRRHRAAQLVNDRVHCHPLRIPRRQPQAQQIGHEGARDPPTALRRDMVGLLGIAQQRGERPTERLRLGPHPGIMRISVVCRFQRGERQTLLPRPHLLF
jgi:hypothetical protein